MRKAADELAQWKTHHEEHKTIDASPTRSAVPPLAVKPPCRRLGRLVPGRWPKGRDAHFLASGREPVGAAARGRPILDAGQLPSAPRSGHNPKSLAPDQVERLQQRTSQLSQRLRSP